MPQDKYEVSGEFFASQKMIRVHVRELIAEYDDDQPVEGKDFDFLIDLFQHHPKATEKLGSGVQKIWPKNHPDYPSRCFMIQLKDGSEDNISWEKCVGEFKPPVTA